MPDPIRAAEEISRMALQATKREEVLQRVVELLVEHFGFYLAAIFLLDETRQNVVLADAAGKDEAASAVLEMKTKGLQIAVGSDSMVGLAVRQNQVRFAAAGGGDIYPLHDDLKVKIRSAASLPISAGDQVWGVLDVQQTDPQALDAELVAVLKMITHQTAAVLRNFSLLDHEKVREKESSIIFQASHRIAQAGSIEEVMDIAEEAVISSAFPSLVLKVAGNVLEVGAINPLVQKPDLKEHNLNISQQEFEPHFADGASLLACDFEQPDVPECLVEIPFQLSWKTATYLPVRRQGKLETVFVFGAQQNGSLDPSVVQSYAALAGLVSTALEKWSAVRLMEKRMDALQTFTAISQAVSMETDISSLYKIIHQEVTRVMGELDFLIATYDPAEQTIQIPYMYEGGAYLTTAPFPVGEGLTSILIKTSEPLMLVEDTEAKAAELGAKVLGKPAKSWLGVPLLVAGEVTGAMVVQDLEHEHRFDEDDLRMLNTLAVQVAVAIRNTRLLESTHKQAERERLLFEITNKIRLASDMKTILATTATELREALNARQAGIKIGVDETKEPQPPEDGQVNEQFLKGSIP
jgi:GAF domain-containing protein